MATVGSTAREIKLLFEQSMEKGAVDPAMPDEFIPPSRAAFCTNLEQLMGIETHFTARGRRFKKFNRARCKIDIGRDPKDMGNLDIAAFGEEMAGRKWATHYEQNADAIMRGGNRFEAVGTPIMASALPITMAINDAYGIFLDSRVYMEEADASYIADEFHTVEEPIVTGNGAIVNGGFRAGRRTNVASNDRDGVDVGEGIIPPSMGQPVETLLHVNRARKNERQYAWTLDAVRFNRIAQGIDEALNAGRVVKYEEERKTADIVLGVGTSLASAANSTEQEIGSPGYATPVQVGDLEFYPYQNGSWAAGGTALASTNNAGCAIPSPINGLYEQNYANAYDTNGAGITMAVLERVLQQRILNRDPFTGDVIPASLKGDTIFVANDAAEVQLLTLLFTWFIGQGYLYSGTTAGTPAPSLASVYNFAREQGLVIKKSQRWANRLTDVGVLTDEATIGTFLSQVLTFSVSDTYTTAGSVMSFFVLGRPKDCIGKNQLQPFMVEDFNVPGDMQMRGIAGLRKVSERSMTFFKDVPRNLNRAYA